MPARRQHAPRSGTPRAAAAARSGGPRRTRATRWTWRDGRRDHRLERDALGARLAGQLVEQRAALPRELLQRQRDDQQQQRHRHRAEQQARSGGSGRLAYWPTMLLASAVVAAGAGLGAEGTTSKAMVIAGSARSRATPIGLGRGDAAVEADRGLCVRIWTAFVSIRSRSPIIMFQLCRGWGRGERTAARQRATASCALAPMM